MARRAFTLIEILVVITVIVILIALVLPALARGRTAARRTQCGVNLHSIGVAFCGYLNDNKGVFPVHGNWGNAVGKLGASLIYDTGTGTGFPGDQTSAGVAVPIRPVNRYLDSPLAARCPDDRGDSLRNNIRNCYNAYGTSYLIEWQYDCYGVAHVTGDGVRRRPLREDGAPGPLSRKAVMGDWVWHANRSLALWSNQWHNPRGLRQYMMLFADAHSEYFTFPKEIEASEWAGDGVIKPDPSRGWW